MFGIALDEVALYIERQRIFVPDKGNNVAEIDPGVAPGKIGCSRNARGVGNLVTPGFALGVRNIHRILI
jgi:hypothetical protein